MTVRDALSRLQQAADDGRLDDVCTSLGLRVLTVFGSAVTDPDAARDLDIAVQYEPGQHRSDLRTIDALITLTGDDRVDLLVLDDATATARRNAVVPTLPLFEREPGGFATLQMAALTDYLDTAWLRRLELESLGR